MQKEAQAAKKVKVVVRVRPFLKGEPQQKCVDCVRDDPAALCLRNVSNPRESFKYKYVSCFDQIIHTIFVW